MPNLNVKWCVLEIDQDTNEKSIYWYSNDLCEGYSEFILLERKSYPDCRKKLVEFTEQFLAMKPFANIKPIYADEDKE